MKILEIKRSDLSASKISIDEKNVTCRLNKETITFHFRYSLNGRSSIILGEFDKDNWSSENAIEIVAKYNDYKKQVKSGVDIKNILVQEKKEAERELYRWTLADACTNHIKEDMRGDHATRRNYTTIIYKHILGLKKKKIKGFEEWVVEGDSKDDYKYTRNEISKTPINEIRWVDLQKGILDRIFDRETGEGHPRTSDKAAQLLYRIFRTAKRNDECDFNVATDFKINGTNIRKRVMNPNEIALICRELLNQRVDAGIPLLVAFYLGCRIGELHLLKDNLFYDGVNGNLDPNGNWWKVPVEHTKGGKQELSKKGVIKDADPYWFYLAPQVKALINTINQDLPSVSILGRTFKEAVLKAGVGDKLPIKDETTDPRPRAHDMRRTFATEIEKYWATNYKWVGFASVMLHHSKDTLGKTYQQYMYANEMKEAYLWWAGELDRMINGATVIRANFKSN